MSKIFFHWKLDESTFLLMGWVDCSPHDFGMTLPDLWCVPRTYCTSGRQKSRLQVDLIAFFLNNYSHTKFFFPSHGMHSTVPYFCPIFPPIMLSWDPTYIYVFLYYFWKLVHWQLRNGANVENFSCKNPKSGVLRSKITLFQNWLILMKWASKTAGNSCEMVEEPKNFIFVHKTLTPGWFIEISVHS